MSMWKMLGKESKGVHIGYVDLLTFPRDCENALREVRPVETSINPPLPCLRVASDRSASEEDARAITTIHVEGREASGCGSDRACGHRRNSGRKAMKLSLTDDVEDLSVFSTSDTDNGLHRL